MKRLALFAALLVLAWTPAHAGELTVAGRVISTSGGFLFPGGGIQTSAGGAYAQIVVVASSGGDFTTIQGALDSIGDASTTKRYLVRVAPGIYSETITMKPFVDVEGAGVAATRITSAGFPAPDTGTVVGADDVELRQLTVENTGGASYSVGIFCDGVAPSVREVAVEVSGAFTWDFGIRNQDGADGVFASVTATASGAALVTAIFNEDSSPILTRVTAIGDGGMDARGVENSSVAATPAPRLTDVTAIGKNASNTNIGVRNSGASPRLERVTARAEGGSAAYGVYSTGDSEPTAFGSVLEGRDATSNYGLYSLAATTSGTTVLIEQSEAIGATATVRVDTNVSAKVLVTLLDGGVPIANGGAIDCGAVADASYSFFPSTCS